MDTGHPSSGSAPTCSRLSRRPWTRGRRCPGSPWRCGRTCRSGSTRSPPGRHLSLLGSPDGRRPQRWDTRGRSVPVGRSDSIPFLVLGGSWIDKSKRGCYFTSVKSEKLPVIRKAHSTDTHKTSLASTTKQQTRQQQQTNIYFPNTKPND